LREGTFDVVVACDLARGIGINNKLPWRLSADMKYFRELTQGETAHGQENFVIMGRNTWQSIPAKHRPLPHRRNIVLTSKSSAAHPIEGLEGANQTFSSFDDALQYVFCRAAGARCFVIGGAKVYEQALAHEHCDRLYLTQIKAAFECDVFFPPFEDKFSLLSETEVQEENGVSFSFKVYKRCV